MKYTTFWATCADPLLRTYPDVRMIVGYAEPAKLFRITDEFLSSVRAIKRMLPGFKESDPGGSKVVAVSLKE